MLPSGLTPLQPDYLEFKGQGLLPYHCTFLNAAGAVTVTAHGGEWVILRLAAELYCDGCVTRS